MRKIQDTNLKGLSEDATKGQIKKAVEELYGVRVLSVATQVRKGQMRRNRMGWFRVGSVKHAIVKLHAEDRIELF